jgi:site-specific recombinase XerD
LVDVEDDLSQQTAEAGPRAGPGLQHPLVPAFERAVESLSTALSPGSKRNYDITVRNFLLYLGADHPEITCLEQLRRNPHILGWRSRLRAQTPPLATATCIGRLIALRSIFSEMAWSKSRAELARLVCSEDIPRTPQRLPRPLTAEQDQLLQQEFLRRNDLGGNVFLLIRHTGMRIGECVDLSNDCLRSTGPHQWAIHVPLGKLKPNAWSPSMPSSVNSSSACASSAPSILCLPMDGSWLVPGSKVALVCQLRDYLHQVCHSLNLSTRIVPHQLRHSYATEMLRSGVSFPVLMKLLGHVNPEMTMRYVDVALADLQREFQLARSHPRHLLLSQGHPPNPGAKASSASSIPCSHRNMSWRCSVAHSQTAMHARASIGSPTASPNSSPKYANSKPPE